MFSFICYSFLSCKIYGAIVNCYLWMAITQYTFRIDSKAHLHIWFPLQFWILSLYSLQKSLAGMLLWSLFSILSRYSDILTHTRENHISNFCFFYRLLIDISADATEIQWNKHKPNYFCIFIIFSQTTNCWNSTKWVRIYFYSK